MANLHVNLAFNADTGKAKAQIQELQTLLSKIAYTGSTMNVTGTMQDDLKKASMAAKDLQFHLNNAFNTTTGKFDLSLLDKSLKTSGTNISNLSTQLLGAGETGQQAFMKLAQSISLADQPMLRVSKRMQEFAVTMKNTVKWQLSSSMLHGFMGAIQSAYGYAQDLNKSLTDIRIVTGYSADQMAIFAEQANKAAKSLSTTTNDYTNASLIYFQQGLTDAEVAERTAVTVKMANAAGESAQIVSDQLTAVWNNFYDGSKSLEYYADVMTALGAATASSTDEISEGLSKFAAVAETVGLSYEYATAALTTITSNTRESADVVGNALKTLFARIQGLKLGETLEDGVDLNKYSEALDKAGISIFESNGELKAMDNILIELAGRWDTMSNTQQVALAQTVAGVRQYTQLIALMENWDNGDADSMMANLRTIEGAEGALDEQAEIYAQSWEAASKRVQAAAEGIYQSLLDDDFFISLNNGFANLLGGLDAFIDGAGGVKTVLIGLAGIVSTVFANRIPEAFDTFKYNLEVITKGTQSAYDRIQKQMSDASDIAFNKYNIKKDSSMGFAITSANELTAARNKLALISDKMSASELQLANTELAIIQAQQQEVMTLKQKNEELQRSIELQAQTLIDPDHYYAFERDEKAEQKAEKTLDIISDPDQANIFGDNFSNQLTQIPDAARQIAESLNNTIVTALQNVDSTADSIDLSSVFTPMINILKQLDFSAFNGEIEDNISTIQTQIKALIDIIPKGMKEILNLDNSLEDLGNIKTQEDLNKWIENLIQSFKDAEININEVSKALKDVNKNPKPLQDLIKGVKQYKTGAAEAKTEQEKLNQSIANFNPQHVIRVGEALGKLGGMMGSLAASLSSLFSAFRTIFNPDVSGWEKFIAVLTAVSITLPLFGNAVKQATQLIEFLSKAENLSTIQKGLQVAATWLQIKATKMAGNASKEAAKDINKETIALKNNTKEKLKNAAVDQLDGQLDFFDQMEDVAEEVDNVSDGFKKLKAGSDVLKNTFNILKPSLTGLGQSILNIGKAILKFVGWKAVAVGAIYGIVNATKYFMEADARAAEQADKAAQEARKKQQEAQSAYNDLTSNIKNIDSGYEALQDMTRGTDEWTQAIMELNAQIMSLIDLYPALAGAIKMVNGALVIDKQSEVYKNFINEQLEILNNANIQAYDAQIESNNANLQSQKTNVRRDISAWGHMETDEGPQPIYQTLSKSQFDQLLQGVISGSINLNDADSISRGLGFDNYDNINYDNLISAIIEASTAIYNLASIETGLIASNEALSAQIGSNTLMTNKDYQASENQSLIDAAVGKAYGEQNFDNWLYKRNSDTNMLDEYARIKGYDSQYSTYNPFTGKTTYKDKDGKVLDEVSNADILETVNIDDWANNGAVNIMKQVEQLMAQITDDSLKRILEAAVTGSTIGLNEADYDISGDIESLLSEEVRSLLVMLFGEGILQDIQTYINMTASEASNFDLENWKKDYAARMKVINDLETGDTISAKDYAVLGEEYAQYFQVQADGTAILIAKAEDLKSAIDNISLESLKKEIGSQQFNLDKTEDIFNKSNNSKMSLDAITSKAEQGLLSTEQQTQYIQAVTEAFGGQYESAEAAAAAIRSYQASLNENQNILASTADNIDELNEMMKQGAIDAEEYYNNVDGTVLKEASKEGFDTEELLEYAETLESVIEDQENAESISKRLALQNQKLQKGIDSLGDNWKDWSKALKTGNKDSKNYIEALTGIKNAMSDMLDIDVSLLSEEFITSSETAKLLEKAVKGDLDAIDQLRIAAAKDIIQKVTVDLDETSQEKVLASIMELANADVTIGASLDSTGFTDALNEMILNSQMTIDDIMNILNALGWEPEIDYKEIPVSEATQSQIAQAVEIYDPLSGKWETATVHSISNAHQDAIVRVPIIKGSSTTYGGSAKTAATPPTPKSSGGGGTKTKKETKQRDDEVERYHVVKEQMEELEKQAEKLSKAKDQAFGKGKLNLIEKEIELLDEQIKKQDEYLKQIQKYGEEDKALMIVYGAQFDENGVITNYEQLMDQELARYNAAVESYNSNYNEKEFAAAEARYEKFLSDMKQYEETMDEWDEAQAERADMLRKIYDLKFEALTYEIEVDIELEEDNLKLLDYYLEKLDDDAFSAAESITLLSKKTQDLLDQSKIYSDGIVDLLSLHGLSDERIDQYMNGALTEQELITMGFSDEDIATLREYRDNLLEINKDLNNIREEIYTKITEAFDAWNEKIVDNIEKIEKLNKVLNSYQNIIDIVGINTLKIDDKFMKNLSNAIVDNSKKVLDASVKKYKSLQEAQLQAQQQYEKSLIEGNEETIRYWEETLEHINNEVQNAEQDMMDSWQNALQAAADAFDKSIENIVNSFEKALSGSFGNLDNLSEMFEWQTEISDRYLADYEKIYQLSKLNRDINNSIDDTDSIKAKRILKSLQEEINDLQSSEQEMSQYDLEYLQKKYELKLAEIALEEAQNAKSTVRLMQDSEGNWSYVYTNDQEKISDAQQRYEDALFSMQVSNEDYIQDLQEKALQAQKAMTEAIKSIDKTQFATEDAYKERIDQIREYYMDQQNYYYDEMAKALSNNKELYENDWLNYSNLTNYKISSDKEYVDNFAETTYAQIMGYNSIEEAQDNFIAATDIMVEEIIESYTLWLNNMEEIMDLAGTSIDTFVSDAENNLEHINTKTDEVSNSIDDLSQDIVDDFDSIIDTVSDWEDNYVNAIDTTIQANEDMCDSCNSLIGMLNNVDVSISNTGKNFSSTAQQIAKAAADIAAAAQRAAAAAQSVSSSGGSVSSSGGSVSSNNNTSNKESTMHAAGTYTGSIKTSTYKTVNGVRYVQATGNRWVKNSDLNIYATFKGGSTYDARNIPAYAYYDTGGYTGAWGTSGKLAVLHEKELVLNAEDTQNMLNAVNIVREITKAIDLNAGIQSLGLQLQNLSNLTSGVNNPDIQQIVQITAEFPDAVYHNEIEEAFKTLLNESSQYIGRDR